MRGNLLLVDVPVPSSSGTEEKRWGELKVGGGTLIKNRRKKYGLLSFTKMPFLKLNRKTLEETK